VLARSRVMLMRASTFHRPLVPRDPKSREAGAGMKARLQTCQSRQLQRSTGPSPAAATITSTNSRRHPSCSASGSSTARVCSVTEGGGGRLAWLRWRNLRLAESRATSKISRPLYLMQLQQFACRANPTAPPRGSCCWGDRR